MRVHLRTAVVGVMLVALANAASAQAVAPVLTSVDFPTYRNHPTFHWSLPTGTKGTVQAIALETATSPEVGTEPLNDGYFLQDNVLTFTTLDPTDTSYTDLREYGPGTYYVHVEGYNPDYTCSEGTCFPWVFSNILSFTIIAPSPPTNLAVGQSSYHITATWTIPQGMQNDFIEASASPDVLSDGTFVDPALHDALTPAQSTYSSATTLAPATYYVHVAAAPAGCAQPCVDEFSEVKQVTIPSPAAPAAPAPPTSLPSPVDNVTSFSLLKVATNQKASRLVVQVAMAENGTITVGGTVNVPNTSKVYTLKSVSVTAFAGKAVKVKVKLPKRVLDTATRALKRRKKVKANFTITARDVTGNKKIEKRAVNLKR
jgi:hypothetical protein